MPLLIAFKGKSGFSARNTAEDVTKGIDGHGLTAIITEPTSGIGLETARVLALRGVHVVMAARNVEAAAKCKETIIKSCPSATIDVMKLELRSLKSVTNFANEYISMGLPLNILICNAGVTAPPFSLSKDGSESRFATNYLGHFHLTNLLLDTMKNTAKICRREGRIVLVSSEVHRLTYKGGIIGIIYGLFKHLQKNISQGASTTCYLALNPKVKGVSGEYFADNNVAKPSGYAKDAELAKKLWECGHFHLTNLLLDTMKNTAKNWRREGRIVLVSSEVHRLTYKGGIIGMFSLFLYNSFYAYGQSKLANTLHAKELTRRLKEEGADITINALHPGITETSLSRHSNFMSSNHNFFHLGFSKTGASTTCYLALNPKVKGVSGEYFADNNMAKPSSNAKDAELAKKLWECGMELTKSKSTRQV
uniref:Putative glucose/ribitol dehydrogenase n=1 Tax=Helianthus annuus TaxID=4232 RepID=A0A251VBC2_HELAN